MLGGWIWVQEPGDPTCDLWRLHHSFLEEGFCLCKGQKCLWCSAQTLVPRGSLGGEAILLVCWERLQPIHQGPRQLLAWQAVDEGATVSTLPPSPQATPQVQPKAAFLLRVAGTSTEAPGALAPLSAQLPSAILRVEPLQLS